MARATSDATDVIGRAIHEVPMGYVRVVDKGTSRFPGLLGLVTIHDNGSRRIIPLDDPTTWWAHSAEGIRVVPIRGTITIDTEAQS